VLIVPQQNKTIPKYRWSYPAGERRNEAGPRSETIRALWMMRSYAMQENVLSHRLLCGS
jgi:hypothetical protein